MKFSDGMEFDTTSTSYRVVRKTDGYYVVGRGMLIPVSDASEGWELIDRMLAAEGHSSR